MHQTSDLVRISELHRRVSLVDRKDMRSVLVLRALAILFPRRTVYYPLMYISFGDTHIILSDVLYNLYGSAFAAFPAAVRFSLMDRGLCAWGIYKTAWFRFPLGRKIFWAYLKVFVVAIFVL
jgi:hypothetical protein